MITIYYDVISPYAYMGLELFKRSSLFKEQKFELIPVLLAKLLQFTNNPGPNGIELKRYPIIMDTCLQAKFFDIELQGPPKHPFINLPLMRFLHCIDNQKLRFEVALILNKACWARSISVEREEEIIAILAKEYWQDEWRDLDKFIKENNGRKKLKDATSKALENNIFGVPTFRYKEVNFWGSDRIKLLEEFIKNPQYYLDNSYEKMINRSVKATL